MSPPVQNPQSISGIQSSPDAPKHALLGLWTMVLDPLTNSLEPIPMRDAAFHLNALRFLEPPPPVNIFLSNIQFDGEILDVDVQLNHPFPGFPKYSGFDVNGIVIGHGSISGFDDPDILIGGEGNTRLINADGLSRWWNPSEFPYNPEVKMWGYIDGNKGVPNSTAGYNAILNGYKYYADGLGPDDSLSSLDLSMRGVFSAGTGNTRHYKIEMDNGFVFNYAVDAVWELPVEDPVIIPDSFPESANRAEPYFLSAQLSVNTLEYDISTGITEGVLGIEVLCADWFDADKNILRMESPGNFDPVQTSVVTEWSADYPKYYLEVIDPDLSALDPFPVWISAESDQPYDIFLPGKNAATYLPPIIITPSQVQGQGGIVLFWNDEGVIDHPSRTLWNDIEPALIIDGENELHCSFSWYIDDGSGYTNNMHFATSSDNGHTFGTADWSGWHWHSGPYSLGTIFNNKYCLSANGWSFQSYKCPAGHALCMAPDLPGDLYMQTRSHSGTIMENAGEMLYTVDGNPMMFGDQGGTILMRRGDFPNQGGTGEWPIFGGTEHVIVAEALLNWLSVSRSALKTSDGICHLAFWHEGGPPYIRKVSSSDTSGTAWDEPMTVFGGEANFWLGASNPGMWIDSNDGFHVVFDARSISGHHHLMYGFSADGIGWETADAIFQVDEFDLDDGLNDTQVVLFDAFDETWVFLSYETGGNVYTRYKKFGDTVFSDPFQVNVSFPAALPDVYPNGDTGVIFAYQADDGTGMTDIYYRLAEWIEE
jgi:hypothetical protein